MEHWSSIENAAKSTTQAAQISKLADALDQAEIRDTIEEAKKLEERRLSLSDEAYMDAVNKGDMDAAQRMVDTQADNADIRYSLDD